jgi:hypothetical protein
MNQRAKGKGKYKVAQMLGGHYFWRIRDDAAAPRKMPVRECEHFYIM